MISVSGFVDFRGTKGAAETTFAGRAWNSRSRCAAASASARACSRRSWSAKRRVSVLRLKGAASVTFASQLGFHASLTGIGLALNWRASTSRRACSCACFERASPATVRRASPTRLNGRGEVIGRSSAGFTPRGL